jgi:hypothetical protein
MTKASHWRVGIIVATVLVAVTVSVLLIGQHPKALPLSLVFERYSTRMEVYLEDVAFLWLTNASDKTYYLAMTGNTNTRQLDTVPGLGHYKATNIQSESVMVDCAFSDRTPTGTTNWAQRVSFTNASHCLTLASHSAVRLRVPLPPQGQRRKVAVLCVELPTGPSRFWLSSFGARILRLLPRSVGRRVLQPKFTVTVLKVWCDRELSHSDDSAAKR